MAYIFPELYKVAVLKAVNTIDLVKVRQVIDIFTRAREKGRNIFVCGNGGSASSASHFVCDMAKSASFNCSKRFRIMALTDSIPMITAYANDIDFESVFVEQLKNYAQPEDVVMAISSSGNSKNVLRVIEYGNSISCCTISLTGRDGGTLGPLSQINIQVSCPHTGCIEDVHMVILHMICCYFIDSEKFPDMMS